MTMKCKAVRFTDVGVVVDDPQGDRLEVDGHGPALPLGIVASITCTDVPARPSTDSSTVWLDETATSAIIGFLNGKLHRFQAAQRERERQRQQSEMNAAVRAARKEQAAAEVACVKHEVADDDCATCGDADQVDPPTIQSLYERIEKIALEAAECCGGGEEAARWIAAAREARAGAQEAENRGA